MTNKRLDVGHRMAAGAGWLILLKMTERGIGVVSTLILVRVLVPADFGLVAMAMSLVALIEALGAFGLDMALIRNQQSQRTHYDTVWTINVLYGLGACAVLCASSIPVATFYAEPRLQSVMLFLGASAFVQSLENVGIVEFQKELRFDREFAFRLAKKVAGFVVTIILAFSLKNYWALLWGSAAVRVTGVALSFAVHSYRPRLSLRHAGELWRFSLWMWLNNAIVFAATRGYDFIIGKICGARELGLYGVSYEVATLPTTELADPISRALFPGFSTMTGERATLKRNVLGSAGIIAAITLPLGVGLMLLAEPAVRLLLGAKWLEAVPLVSVLAIYGVMRAAHAGTGVAYIALGQPRLISWINLPHLVVGWPLMLMMLPRFGVHASAYCVIVASACGLCINYMFARRHLDMRAPDVLGYYWKPAVACGVMGWAISAFTDVARTGPSAALGTAGFAGAVAIGAVTYVVTLFVAWRLSGRPDGAERLILEWLRARLARHGGKTA